VPSKRAFEAWFATFSQSLLSLPFRVTRLGDFLPVGLLFTLSTFLLLNYPKFWATFFHGNIYALSLTKNDLGHILGDFPTNSSGRPAPLWPSFEAKKTFRSFDLAFN
jgi:hypothetical protein